MLYLVGLQLNRFRINELPGRQLLVKWILRQRKLTKNAGIVKSVDVEGMR